MNRNMDNSPLTTEQLRAIAEQIGLDAGAMTDGKSANCARSSLLDATRNERYRMFMAGKLKLDTRTPSNTTQEEDQA